MSTKTFTTFRVSEQLFGIEILFVREINKHLEITLVQHAPDYIRGLVNLRGQIVTVFDLNQRLSGGSSRISDNSCNLIIKTENELAALRRRENRPDLLSTPDTVSFVIDDIDEIVTLEDAEIEPPPMNLDKRVRQYLTGVIKLNTELIGILSVPRLLELE